MANTWRSAREWLCAKCSLVLHFSASYLQGGRKFEQLSLITFSKCLLMCSSCLFLAPSGIPIV